MSDYQSDNDQDCYPESQVLINLANLQIQSELDEFESARTESRAEEGIPVGKLDKAHYLAIHRHLFQDVYPWAGQIRTVRITKNGSTFCYPENIDSYLDQLFEQLKRDNSFRGLTAEEFAEKAASFLADLNAAHPFREGNGRVQHLFLALLAYQAGFSLIYPDSQTELDAFKNAVIQGFFGNLAPLTAAIRNLMEPR